MKKTFKSLLSIFLAVFMVASLMAIPSSAASLSKTSITLTKGYQTTLSVSGASSVKWSTGDKSIATVSSKGKVVGKAPGTTYIYAKTGSTTLKCKVKVVAAKITASNSNVELDAAGDTQIVTMTVKGSHSGLTVGSTNRSVASASWVKPVQWDGNKIKIKITAKGEGTCRIKVYLKKYKTTCYKYIDVTVGSNLYEEDDPNDSDMNIVAYSKNVQVNAGNTYNLDVYCTNQKNLAYSVINSNIASVSAGSYSGNYRTFTIKGLTAGTTTIRFYDKNNSKKYVDVTVKVGSDVAYYEFYTTRPTSTPLTTDKIITVQISSYSSYYMVVPANYDEAYTNRLIADRFKKYEYYKVYDSIPSRIAANDTYQSFYHSNSNYKYGERYILLPANYDEVKLNTTIAKYNNYYEYYTIYNEKPTLPNAWDDVKTWNVIDGSTGKTITRYMLVPYYNYDQNKVDEIINKDKNSNNVYSYYNIYSTYPTINAQTDDVITYTKNGTWRYMVVPKTGSDVLKINETIKNDTGVYEAYIMYESQPTPNTTKGEYVLSSRFGDKRIFVLCTYPQNSQEHQNMWASIKTRSPIGN